MVDGCGGRATDAVYTYVGMARWHRRWQDGVNDGVDDCRELGCANGWALGSWDGASLGWRDGMDDGVDDGPKLGAFGTGEAIAA